MGDNIGRGMAFPVRVNARGGLNWGSGTDSIRQSIWIILTTPLRSRTMLPQFGCAIHDYLFAPNTAATRALVEDAVRQALDRWEPRVDVLSVEAATAPDQHNLLLVDIATRLRTNNAALNLVYPYYLQEGIDR